MPGKPSPDRTTVLAAATLGVYLLVVLGATTSLADAASSCSTWPVCHVDAGSPGAIIALSHRGLAVLVGGLLILTAWLFRTADSWRVKATIALALVLYPVQSSLGALLATTGSAGIAGIVPGVHLLVGLAIFGTLLLALAWHLELETGNDAETSLFGEVEPIEQTAEAESETQRRSPADPGLGRMIRTRANAYFRLMKPRLMWLLCLVAAAAMALAAGPALTVRTIVLTLGGGVLAIGASGTFNHVLEREKDEKMSRTNDRPVVRHQVPPRNAVIFGLSLTALSTAVFLQLNPLAAALGLTAIMFYSVIYTLVLKPNTVQNTVIGGAAGSLPALIGWAAVTGRIGLGGVLLAAFIFVWTPAHFYNLAMAYKEDYARGGFPMMPVVRGETTTRKHVLLWLGATLATATGLIWFTQLGWLTAAASTLLGGVFLYTVVRLHYEQTESAAFRAFHASNAYLGVILVAIVVDGLAF